MSEESNAVFRADKCAAVITAISRIYGVSLDRAADIFYNSETALMIEQHVADLHCRSERYLAQCVWEEYQDTLCNSLR